MRRRKGWAFSLHGKFSVLPGMTIKETGEAGKGARFEITVPEGAYRFTGEQ